MRTAKMVMTRTITGGKKKRGRPETRSETEVYRKTYNNYKLYRKNTNRKKNKGNRTKWKRIVNPTMDPLGSQSYII